MRFDAETLELRRLKSDLTLMYRTVYGHCGLKFASFLHYLIKQLVDIVFRYRNSTVVSIVVRLVLLIAALTLGIVLIMTLYAHRLFRLLKDDWVCTILLSFCMFYNSPRLGMVLVSACLTIHSFSSGISYFKSILLYCVLLFPATEK